MTLHDRRPRAPLFQPLPAALRRALSWRLGFVAAALACVLLLALLSEARAAGGAYRVDDGEIDPSANATWTPGTSANATTATATSRCCRQPAPSPPYHRCSSARRWCARATQAIGTAASAPS